MEHKNTDSAGDLSLLIQIAGLIFFLWSIFSIFYTFIANRTRRLLLRAIAWWVVLLLEINALTILYDRVLNPLKDKTYRWGNIPNTMLTLGIIYVVIYIIAMWDTARVNKRELTQ